MSSQARSPNNFLVFLIGRPGSGKSTFAKYLVRAFISTNVLYLNDYDLLLSLREKLSPEQISLAANGQFEILDRSIFDRLFEELAKAVESNIGKRPMIVEFSRPAYVEAFKTLHGREGHQFTIVYLNSPLETCIHRNAMRAPDYPINTIPEGVIRKYYLNDDLSNLQATYPGRVRVVQNEAAPLHSLEREASLLLEELVGTEHVKI